MSILYKKKSIIYSIMKKKSTTTKNLRISENTHQIISKIADRDGLTLMDTMDLMANYFIKNGINTSNCLDVNLDVRLGRLEESNSRKFEIVNKRLSSLNDYLVGNLGKDIRGLINNIVFKESVEEVAAIENEEVSSLRDDNGRVNNTTLEVISELSRGWVKRENSFQIMTWQKILQVEEYDKIMLKIEKIKFE